MRRYGVFAIPGAEEDDAIEAIRLRAAVEAWYGRAELQDVTIDARRYGFHATLKAPIRLSAGRTEGELLEAADAFSAARAPVVIPGLRPAAIGGFRALLPGGDLDELDAFAADAVREFEQFRAPLNDADLRRRRPERFTRRQRELFERWGYPFVLDEFRFHFTLTDSLPAERTVEIDAALQEHFEGVVGVDVLLTSIAISVEPAPGAPFEILSLHPFATRSALEIV